MGKYLARALSLVGPRRPDPVIKTINGVRFELDLREVIDASLFYAGVFEADAERTITSFLEPGMNAIDVGCNIGYHTFRMATRVGPSGHVLAIDGSSWALRRLRRNLELNDISNIDLVHAGLDARDRGEVSMRFRASYRLDGRRTDEDEVVPIRTLDSIVTEHGWSRVDFIKVDVDGYESKVWRGAETILKRDRPTLFFEITPAAMRDHGDTADELITWLEALGYRFETERREPLDNVRAFCARIPAAASENLVARATP